MRHHYVPQFLLNRWTNAAGKLRMFTIQNGRIVASLRAPKYTGYEDGLYAIVAHALRLSNDHIEQKLFSPIDNNAAKALEKLEQHRELTEDDHIAWTFFLSSLKVRQRETLEFLRTHGAALRTQILAQLDAGTLHAGAPSTEQWFNQHFPGVMEASSLTNWLPRMIANPDVLEALGGLDWWFREFSPEAPTLLLSDMPLHWEGGFHEPDFFIQLPIGPRRLFFGTRSAGCEQLLTQMSADDLIGRVNLTTLASSTQRIWASPDDATAQGFVDANRDTIGVNEISFASLAPWANAPTGG